MKLLPLDLTSPGLFAPSAASFPPNLSNPTIKEICLAEPVLAQVLDVQDIGRSRWEQIEALEAVERGERMVGREIIRDVPPEDGEDGAPAAAPGLRSQGQNQRDKKAGPHKLVLQDWKGQTVFALELEAVDKVGGRMCIGAKMLLKAGTVVARGMVLLEPRSASVLGGKIEGLHERWIRDRKKMLAEGIEVAQEEG
jgi:RecQ-mediated genome instability protein 1